MNFELCGTRIRITKGDITEESTDAIVNAANSTLLGGGGVDGAIHRRGGPRILEECRRLRGTEWPAGLPPGRTALTVGGNLRARFVIHTVGPVWRGGNHGEPDLLSSCYRNSLLLAKERYLASIAFPSISTGAYGYPIEKACPVALSTVKEFLTRHRMGEVAFVLFTDSDCEVYKNEARPMFTD